MYLNTLGSAYNEFGYNEHPATASRFLCTIIFDSNTKMFGYNEHPPTMHSFFLHLLLVVSGTKCNIESGECKQFYACNHVFANLAV